MGNLRALRQGALHTRMAAAMDFVNAHQKETGQRLGVTVVGDRPRLYYKGAVYDSLWHLRRDEPIYRIPHTDFGVILAALHQDTEPSCPCPHCFRCCCHKVPKAADVLRSLGCVNMEEGRCDCYWEYEKIGLVRFLIVDGKIGKEQYREGERGDWVDL